MKLCLEDSVKKKELLEIMSSNVESSYIESRNRIKDLE